VKHAAYIPGEIATRSAHAISHAKTRYGDKTRFREFALKRIAERAADLVSIAAMYLFYVDESGLEILMSAADGTARCRKNGSTWSRPSAFSNTGGRAFIEQSFAASGSCWRVSAASMASFWIFPDSSPLHDLLRLKGAEKKKGSPTDNRDCPSN